MQNADGTWGTTPVALHQQFLTLATTAATIATAHAALVRHAGEAAKTSWNGIYTAEAGIEKAYTFPLQKYFEKEDELEGMAAMKDNHKQLADELDYYNKELLEENRLVKKWSTNRRG